MITIDDNINAMMRGDIYIKNSIKNGTAIEVQTCSIEKAMEYQILVDKYKRNTIVTLIDDDYDYDDDDYDYGDYDD